jgi:hypothetical protein
MFLLSSFKKKLEFCWVSQPITVSEESYHCDLLVLWPNLFFIFFFLEPELIFLEPGLKPLERLPSVPRMSAAISPTRC